MVTLVPRYRVLGVMVVATLETSLSQIEWVVKTSFMICPMHSLFKDMPEESRYFYAYKFEYMYEFISPVAIV